MNVDLFSPCGVRFILFDPDSSTVRETMPGNSYEPAVAAILRSIYSDIQSGTFVDVGALYGYFPCFLAKIAPDVDIIAFEPNAYSAAIMRENFRINGLRAAIVHEVAIGCQAESAYFSGKTFTDGSLHSALALSEAQTRREEIAFPTVDIESLKPTTGSSVQWITRHIMNWLSSDARAKRVEVVQCRSIGEFISGRNTGPVVVKVDVHGAEVSVLRSISVMPEQCIDVLFLELHTDKMLTDGSHRETVALLKALDMEIFEIRRFRSDRRWAAHRMDEADLERLSSSGNWRLWDRITMKMLVCIKKGFSGAKLSR